MVGILFFNLELKIHHEMEEKNVSIFKLTLYNSMVMC